MAASLGYATQYRDEKGKTEWTVSHVPIEKTDPFSRARKYSVSTNRFPRKRLCSRHRDEHVKTERSLTVG